MLHPGKIACVLLAASTVLGCGGGGKKKVETKPVVKEDKPTAPPPETEEDREAKRKTAARALVPDGSSCLPAALKESTAPRLQLAAVGGDAVVCAVDFELDRMLGPVACWKVDLASGGVEYKAPAPQPGRGFPVAIDDGCARSYCLPKDKQGDAKVAHIVWSPDTAKVAVLAGDEVHLFDAAAKKYESSFTIRGDKGVPNDPVGITWVASAIFVEGADAKGYSGVWGFKAEGGTPMGGIEGIGAKPNAKPLSTHAGSFVVLDKGRVAVAEQGFSTVTTYEVDTGKRAKLVRKLAKSTCKADETAAFWSSGGEGGSGKCHDQMTKEFSHLIGADAVAGKTSLLVLLRGPRLGELGVLDAKSLAEKKSIKLAWCEGDEKPAAKAEKKKPAGDDDAADEAAETKPAKKATTRGAVPKKAAKDEDPDSGGE